MSANVETMFYYGEVPWHGLGTRLDNPATAEEAIVASGLDWAVHLEDVVTVSGLPTPCKAVVRDDKRLVLGTTLVGRRYTPVQNREAFKFFDEVVGQGQAVYHTAGSLGQGEKVWILAKLPGEVKVAKDDVVEKFVLLSNSHDGTSQLTMSFTPIRVVCQNTLRAALKGFETGAEKGIHLRHTPNILRRVSKAQQVLGLAHKFYDRFVEDAQVLVERKVSVAEVGRVLDLVFEGGSPRAINTRAKVVNLFESEKNQTVGAKGTAWGLYNAIVEYSDWCRKVPKSDERPDRRLNSVWFGSGADLKIKAWDAVSTLVA